MSAWAFKYPNSVTDFHVEAAIGNIPTVKTISKFAQKENTTFNTIQDIWSSDVNVREELVSAERMEVVSSSALDNVSTTSGAKSVEIVGVDNNWNEIKETVNLSGVTPTLTTNAYLRINGVRCLGEGGVSNAGDITLTSEITAKLQDIVPTELGYSASTHYSVPKDRMVMIPNFTISIDKKEHGELFLKAKNIEEADSYITKFKMYLHDATITLDRQYFSFYQKTDIKFQILTESVSLDASAYYTMLQFPKSN